MTQLIPECATQMEYFVFTDSNFCVLSDQSTIIGVSKTNQNLIIKQSITGKSELAVTYTANMKYVYTLAANETQNVLFAGGYGFDSDGQVVQFDLCTGQVVKAFGLVGIGIVLSSLNANNLWIFGSYNTTEFAMIDSVSRQVLGEPVESAISRIYSMTIFKIQEIDNCSKVLLFTIGMFPNYSENRTDVFDITALVTRHLNLSIKQIVS